MANVFVAGNNINGVSAAPWLRDLALRTSMRRVYVQKNIYALSFGGPNLTRSLLGCWRQGLPRGGKVRS